MLSAIQLDDQALFEADKIRDIRWKRMLAPKLVSAKLPIAKAAPKGCLCLSLVLAKCSAGRSHYLNPVLSPHLTSALSPNGGEGAKKQFTIARHRSKPAQRTFSPPGKRRGMRGLTPALSPIGGEGEKNLRCAQTRAREYLHCAPSHPSEFPASKPAQRTFSPIGAEGAKRYRIRSDKSLLIRA